MALRILLNLDDVAAGDVDARPALSRGLGEREEDELVLKRAQAYSAIDSVGNTLAAQRLKVAEPAPAE